MAIGSHLEDFFGKPVKLFEDGSSCDIPGTAPRIFCDVYGETDATWEKSLAAYLAVEGSSKTTHLVSGMATEAYEEPNVNAVLAALIARKAELPNLEALFIGDITFDECELSWLNEGDLRPVWEHFPDLKAFAVRGYPGEMGQISLPKAESFAIQCSGLTKKNAQQIQAADLPNLTHLELWIGTEEYGGETDVSDWEPLLSGKLFPKLKYLGLKNCDFADELAQAVANAPILDRIETLDLSMGTLSDKGAQALYLSERVRGLKHLDLEYHYMSDEMMSYFKGTATAAAKVKVKKGFLGLLGKKDLEKEDAPKPVLDLPIILAGEFGPTVNLNDQQEEDEDYRYVAAGE